ncbi:MAG: hypothetical protein U9R24_05105, partial [Thermodesulfobacteriota bacterium]|nr:hypothetical protein [Thermodesulfobacteriota bacterium]
LALDDSDRPRSKNTKRIHKVYKQKDKKTNGYVNGQTIVLLLLTLLSHFTTNIFFCHFFYFGLLTS